MLHFSYSLRLVAASALGLLWPLLTFGCAHQPSRTQYTFQGPTMGSFFTVKVILPDGPADASPAHSTAEVEQAIQAELEGVNSKMSTYLASSELSQFNRHAQVSPFRVSAETFEVFAEALRIAAITGGALDITVGPLVNAWGFGAESGEPGAPSADELERLQAKVGWTKVEVNPADSTLRKLDPEVYCDLSAVAKGYAVDRVSERLFQMGYAEHMVEVGGEVRTSGRNAARQPWRIAVERPVPESQEIHRVLPLENLAMATSGDYRNFFEQDGVRYSHTIDPRSGRPVAHRLASVSVIDDSCMRADGFATALLVLGEDEGYKLAVQQHLAALFLIRDNKKRLIEKTTPAFQKLFPSDPGAAEGLVTSKGR